MRERSERLATLGTLVASVAHEVNNPTHAIMLNAPVLRQAWHDALAVLDEHAARHPGFTLANVPFREIRDDVARMAGEIEGSAVRIRDIVAAMRVYARKQSREAHTQVDVVAAVRAAIAGRREQIEASCRAFTLAVPHEAVTVLGSQRQIEQLVTHLLDNACAALTDPSQAIRVALRVERSQREVALEVADRGRGIPADRLQDIARPFSSTRDSEPGLGLGLPMSAWIAQQHRGRLAIESTVTTGTCVTVTIPLAPS